MDLFHADGLGTATPSIIRVGENAWKQEKAERLALLVDGEAYFHVLDQALRQARHAITILGWDFNPDIRLRPAEPESPTLGDLLLSLVEANPDLTVRVLVWAMGPLYSGKSLKLFRKTGWAAHPQIDLQFDTHHPLRGSHHQKVVCIDDVLGFIGGIDLTARRWDDSRHAATNPLRRTPDGEPYEPVHDMQAVLSGPAARMLGDLCRDRWEAATSTLMPVTEGAAPIWPEGVEPMVTDCPVALALTKPEMEDGEGRRESIHLLVDALKAARKTVYIEAQYLAAFGIADILIERLADPEGPEVLIVVTRISHGFVEKVMMGNNRDRLIRRLKRADPYDRLRVMYATVPSDNPEDEDGRQEILVHSKLVLVDDSFLRLGSSNLNNRSEGFDTEADIAVEARNAEEIRAFRAMRMQLIAEHIGATPQAVEAAILQLKSMHDGLESLNGGPRRLCHFEIDLAEGAQDPLIGTDLVDPPSPVRTLNRLRRGAGALASRVRSLF